MADNTSATHLVLRNMDTLQEILQVLGLSHAYRTLAGMARVCRAFKISALSVLWYALEDLKPLLSMIPDELATKPFISDVVYNNLPLHRYTTYVKQLTFDKVTSNNSYPKLMFVYRASQGKPLFPRLQRLTLHVWPITATEASLLFSNGLSNIHISTLSRSSTPEQKACRKLSSFQHEQLCIQLLCRRCPNLCSFSYGSLQIDTHPRCLEPIFDLRHLRSLKVTSIPLPFDNLRLTWYAKLSVMDYLDCLSFNLSHASFSPNLIASVPGAFSHLRSFNILANVSTLDVLFNAWYPRALVSIRIRMTQEPILTEEWSRIGKAIEKLVSNVKWTLKHFCFVGKFLTRDSNSLAPPVLETLRPLAQIQCVEKFCIDWSAPFDIIDREIATFANAWPDLRKIRIGTQTINPPSTCPNIQALVVLATRCPKLNTIHLPINFARDNLPPLNTLPSTTLKPRKIYFLGPPNDSTVADRDQEYVASILRRIFPLSEPSSYLHYTTYIPVKSL